MSEAASEWPAVAAVYSQTRAHCNNKGPGLSFQPRIHHTLARSLTEREKESAEREQQPRLCGSVLCMASNLASSFARLLEKKWLARSTFVTLLWNLKCMCGVLTGRRRSEFAFDSPKRERLLLLQEALPRALFSTGPFLLRQTLVAVYGMPCQNLLFAILVS